MGWEGMNRGSFVSCMLPTVTDRGNGNQEVTPMSI